jgi:hypothetical protein
MRSLRHVLTVSTLALLMLLAASSAFASGSNSLSLVKTCPNFGVTHACVVTSSNVAILLGGTFHYLDAASLGTSGSPMLLVTAAGTGTASGKCQFDDATGMGHCRFTSGTGTLAGIHINAQVLFTGVSGGGPNFSLAGTYHFTGD